MTRRSTTVTDDADRLHDELPDLPTAPIEATARLVQAAAEVGLDATIWPLRLMPRSLREIVAKGMRATAASAAFLPHAMARAAGEAADRLDEEDDE